jgi:hypothetical protein
MRKLFRYLFLFAAMIAGNECFAQPEVKGYKQTDIKDLVLIYQGGVHRMDWTKDQFLPYVRHEFADGKKDWLFDGFLFLEFKDGKGRCYASRYEKENARKQEWSWLLDRLFEQGKALSALNACIEEQKAMMGLPPFRHRVVIGLPEPIPGQTDWGELKGKALNFHNDADKFAACKWYIDELRKRFAKAQLNNLDLAGYYWVSEDIVTSRNLTIPIGKYIRSLGQQFYWIPYWNAMGYSEWKSLGFDVAYAQPNHFFNDNISDDRINSTCRLAATYNMGLEMEFDDRALADHPNSYRSRLISYIDRFEDEGVFRRSSLAYYEGGGCILHDAKSANPLDRELMDRLASLICRRHEVEQQKPFAEQMVGYGKVAVKMYILPTADTKINIRLSVPSSAHPGTITMMEYDSHRPDTICGGIDTPAFNMSSGNKKGTTLPVFHLCGTNHVFSCMRNARQIKLFVDDVLFFAMDNDFGTNLDEWPFVGPLRLSIDTTVKDGKSKCMEVTSVDVFSKE